MKQLKTLMKMGVITLILALGMTGCGREKGETKADSEARVTVQFGDTPIIIGKSKVKELQEAGYEIMAEKTLEGNMATETIPTRTYYLVCYVAKAGELYSDIQFLNASETEEIPVSEGVINKIEFNYQDIPYEPSYKADEILIEGNSFKGMKVDEVDAKMASLTSESDEFKNPDGTIGVKTYIIGKTRIAVTFDYETKEATIVTVEKDTNYFA